MKAINKTAQKVLETVIGGLLPGESRKIDNAGGAFMALSVERLTEATYSVAHYYEQNGDLIADPDMVFLRGGDGRFYPIELTNAFGHNRAAWIGRDGSIERFAPRLQAELATFAATWMRNIKHQQLAK